MGCTIGCSAGIKKYAQKKHSQSKGTKRRKVDDLMARNAMIAKGRQRKNEILLRNAALARKPAPIKPILELYKLP